ncbi:Surface antigen [Anaplasma phagocytophilum]|uniref:Surface antigen n=1 Tax=Anaplasma phagocytophilum TaxID=948 RepID=A0AA45ZHZ3_ANAPH|nr:P44/Msp2 family outer membrane protein [Anaplasma phagocytophilum]SBO14862.1 Surface antigen [Anaplasma phagocytophilum]
MEISHSDIGKKVCNKSYAVGKESTQDNSGITDYGEVGGSGTTGQCSGLEASSTSSKGNLNNFISKTRIGEGKNWPTANINSSNSNKVGETNSNAKAVATDLVALNRDEKTIVAGLLAKTIEGGEVVEIRAVSSTSVMVNACYDLLSEGLGVVTYACSLPDALLFNKVKC